MQRKFRISFLCIVTKKLDNKLAILDKIKYNLTVMALLDIIITNNYITI